MLQMRSQMYQYGSVSRYSPFVLREYSHYGQHPQDMQVIKRLEEAYKHFFRRCIEKETQKRTPAIRCPFCDRGAFVSPKVLRQSNDNQVRACDDSNSRTFTNPHRCGDPKEVEKDGARLVLLYCL